jgi:hypothetical protein
MTERKDKKTSIIKLLACIVFNTNCISLWFPAKIIVGTGGSMS